MGNNLDQYVRKAGKIREGNCPDLYEEGMNNSGIKEVIRVNILVGY